MLVIKKPTQLDIKTIKPPSPPPVAVISNFQPVKSVNLIDLGDGHIPLTTQLDDAGNPIFNQDLANAQDRARQLEKAVFEMTGHSPLSRSPKNNSKSPRGSNLSPRGSVANVFKATMPIVNNSERKLLDMGFAQKTVDTLPNKQAKFGTKTKRPDFDSTEGDKGRRSPF